MVSPAVPGASLGCPTPLSQFDRIRGSNLLRYLSGARSKVVTGLLVILGLLTLAAGIAMVVGGYSLNTVTSGSMRPGIQPGDLVVLQGVDATSLKVGDVIAYIPPTGGEPLLHRITSLTSSDGVFVQTQGDANNTPDFGPVHLGATASRLAWSVPALGWLIVLRSWVWLAFGGVLVLMALGWFKRVLPPRLRKSAATPAVPPSLLNTGETIS